MMASAKRSASCGQAESAEVFFWGFASGGARLEPNQDFLRILRAFAVRFGFWGYDRK